MELRRKIKKETQSLHEKLDSDPLSTNLLSEAPDRENYLLLLWMHRFALKGLKDTLAAQQSSFEKAIEDIQTLLNVLDKDLESWEGQAPILSFTSEFSLETTDQGLGALYVLYGSSLGSQKIVAHLSQQEGALHLPRHFYEEMSKKHYVNRFKQVIAFDQVEDDHQVVGGAERTFGLYLDIQKAITP